MIEVNPFYVFVSGLMVVLYLVVLYKSKVSDRVLFGVLDGNDVAFALFWVAMTALWYVFYNILISVGEWRF